MHDDRAYRNETASSLANRCWRRMLRHTETGAHGDLEVHVGRHLAIEGELLADQMFAETGVNRLVLGDDRPKILAVLREDEVPAAYAFLAPTGGRFTAGPLPRRIGMISVFSRADVRGKGYGRRVVEALGSFLDDALTPALEREAVLVGEARILAWARPLLPLPLFARHICDREPHYTHYVTVRRRRLVEKPDGRVPSYSDWMAAANA